ncbi:MAG: putative DNA binding domain-containing protein [Treponema sp.]|nr:putative DNA binding domain-containing protein [Treponema sp.]
MDEFEIKRIIKGGENLWTEFKRCGNGIESDVYETVCAFSNRFGGRILCGVLDDGTVTGIPPKSITSLKKNFTSIISNPDIFSPTLMIEPESVKIEGKTILCIYVPVSPDLHTYKKTVYDRSFESDIKVTGTTKIAEMYIRKQNIFTEKKVFKYAGMTELDSELIEKCRRLALLKNNNHPWRDMTQEEIVKSAHLFGKDWQTGDEGMTLAGLLLLGREDVVSSVCPTYKTDANLRKANLDRYDDRLIIYKNLIESYDLLMQFAQKHLPDKFFMEGIQTVSLRDKIVREMISNILMHREFSSAYVSKFIIESDRIYTENPCRAQNHIEITPENFTPVSKNPIIAHFFTNIGYADELGSGTRNLFKYTQLYSGLKPKMIEDEMFTTSVPLDENYSADYQISGVNTMAVSSPKLNLSKRQQAVIEEMRNNPEVTATQIATKLGVSSRTVETMIKFLRENGFIERDGATKHGLWVVKQK